MPKLINECNVFTTRQQNNKEQHFVPSSEGNSKQSQGKNIKQAQFLSDEFLVRKSYKYCVKNKRVPH